MKKAIVLFIVVLCTWVIPMDVISQGVAINSDGSDPHSSAILDISSTSQGVLFPRMTLAQRNAIVNPASGLIVFVTKDSSCYKFDGSGWEEQLSASSSGDLTLQGNLIGGMLLDTLEGSTYTTVQDFVNLTQSAGVLEGGIITDNGDGTIDVSGGKGIIKKSASKIGSNFLFDFPAKAGMSLTDNDFNWIYINYNNGNPQIDASTDFNALDQYTELIIGKVYKRGTELNLMNVGQFFADYERTTCFKDYEVFGFVRASGLAISEVGTRNIAITAGVMYCSHNRITCDAINTSSGDTFTYWYQDGSGDWNTSSGHTQINNLLYDNGSGSLATLSNNRYGVHWIYVTYDGKLNVLYGQDSYKKFEAEAVDAPQPPSMFVGFATLVGKIIIKKGESSATETASAFESVFNYATPALHNDLSDLQGGTTDEYYHLTAAEYAALGTKTPTGAIVYMDSIGIGIDNPQRSLHVKDVIRLEPLDGPPENPSAGDLYFDSNKNKLRCFDGKRWRDAW